MIIKNCHINNLRDYPSVRVVFSHLSLNCLTKDVIRNYVIFFTKD